MRKVSQGSKGGWASVKETVTWADRSFEKPRGRMFYLERGDWKIVQVHWSVPKANVEVSGQRADRQSRRAREDHPA